jgi:hypothetical protein
MRLFHLAEVDNTPPAGAKEDGAVQPTLAVPERAPNEKLAVGEMHKRKIPTRFENGDILDPYYPTFDIVGQESKIVTIKCGTLALALISGSERLFRGFLDCHQMWRAGFETNGKIGLQNGYITLTFKAIR